MTLGTYLRLGRVSNLPTVWTNVLAGVVLASGRLVPTALAVLLPAVTLLYTGGMFLNDAFDREIDARERPARPVPSGLVSAAHVFRVGFGMLGAAILLLLLHGLLAGASFGWRAVLSGVALAGAIVLYDAWHKGNPWGPVVMGLCRALVYVTSALAAAGTLGAPVLLGAVALLSYVAGLTYAAKQEGLRRPRNLWPLLLLIAPLLYALPDRHAGTTAVTLSVLLAGWIAYALLLLVRRGPADVPRAVVSLIAGISLLDAVVIARQGAAVPAWVATLGFAATLLLQRFIRGT